MSEKVKRDLRKKYLEIRNELSRKERMEKSESICNLIEKSNEFIKARNILFFAAKNTEVHLFPLIEKYLRKLDESNENSKNIYLPCTTSKTGVFHAKKITSLFQLKKGRFDILEPNEECEKINSEEIDLLLIPAIAIDKQGNRIGFGGGYFDRFLKKTHAFKLAVIFDCQIAEDIPANKMDMPVDAVVTEEGIIKFEQ